MPPNLQLVRSAAGGYLLFLAGAGVARAGASGGLPGGQQVAGDELPEREADPPARLPIVARPARFAPLDPRGAAGLGGGAGGEIQECPGGFRVDGGVAEAGLPSFPCVPDPAGGGATTGWPIRRSRS